MANPTTVVGSMQADVEVQGDTATDLTLDPDWQYEIEHLGVDGSGNDDANSDSPVWWSTSGDATASYAAGTDKGVILDGGSGGDSRSRAIVGPNASNLSYIGEASADAIFRITALRRFPPGNR